MKDARDFVERIRATPDDDAPRLIYADWLEERGDSERADLIRIQCELPNLPWHDKRYVALKKRETKLFRTHKSEWLGELESMVVSAHFERGFVERVALGARQFERHGEAVLSLAPVKTVSLTRVSDKSAGAVAASDALSRIQELIIHGSAMTDAGWKTLLTSELLAGSGRLELSVDFESGNTTPGRVLASLSRCPSLPRIRELRTSFLRLDDAEAQRVFQSLNMPSLRSLRLDQTRYDVLELIGQMPIMERLERLDIRGSRVIGSQVFTQAGSLKSLNVQGSSWTDRDVRFILGSEQFTSLEKLNIAHNQISDVGLSIILAGLPRLKCLTANRIHAGPGLRWLEGMDLPRLEELDLSDVDEAAAVKLAELLRPIKFSATQCGLSDTVLQPLLELDSAKQILWLDLTSNRLTDRTADVILHSRSLDQLRYLSLRENRVSPDLQKSLRAKYGPGVCTFSR